jgi:hypothetical protein
VAASTLCNMQQHTRAQRTKSKANFFSQLSAIFGRCVILLSKGGGGVFWPFGDFGPYAEELPETPLPSRWLLGLDQGHRKRVSPPTHTPGVGVGVY